jgi:RNA polymerase sigma factor (TIGR02999 family)
LVYIKPALFLALFQLDGIVTDIRHSKALGGWMTGITQILDAVQKGDRAAGEQLLPLVYNELRRLAARKLSQEKPGQTLDATGLVHEAYLRLVGADSSQQWDGRGHFFAAAAEAMRRILVENARRKKRVKHGGEFKRSDLSDLDRVADSSADELLAVSDSLEALAAVDAHAAETVRLHFFAGLTLDEVASVLERSPRTVYRDWAFARAWLAKHLAGAGEGR